jgi:hypothetical protein
MAKFLDVNSSGVITQYSTISSGNSSVQNDTTNANKVIETNSNGKLDVSLLWADDIASLTTALATDEMIMISTFLKG